MKRIVRAIAFAVALFGAAGLAQAFVVVPPNQDVAGTSQLELSQQWWQWSLGIPTASSPLTDPDGRFARVNNDGPVFFVAGSITGSPVVRAFGVPAGRPIFFPVFNFTFIETPPPTCLADPDPLGCALAQIAPFIDAATNLNATLDGQNLLTPSPGDYRQTSNSFFLITLPDDNFFGAPAGPYPAVSDGYWVAVEGLSPGPHTLTFGGTSLGFGVDVTARMLVPEPGTLGLVLLGALAAVGGMRSRVALTARRQA